VATKRALSYVFFVGEAHVDLTHPLKKKNLTESAILNAPPMLKLLKSFHLGDEMKVVYSTRSFPFSHRNDNLQDAD
jgi:hypothetical protein